MCIAGGSIHQLSTRAADGLPPASSAAHIQYVAAHDHLFFEGDPRDHIYIVESGWVKLYRTLIDGQRQVVGFANAGSVLGLESESAHANGCEAITHVTVRSIPAARLSTLCISEPALADQILRQISRQLGAAQAQLTAVGAQSAEQKLATFLLSIADLGGRTGDCEFDLPMRRGDMAEFLGLRLETVSRKMADFQRRGWIQMTSLYHCRLVRRSALQSLSPTSGEHLGAAALAG
ncbi:MAG: Crp/Fnr family transcriptional regulator [Burkholderiales bacterium]|nr:MAG: Crp/Fnr family transcriptional regulator [Burkholderiales bacterium]